MEFLVKDFIILSNPEAEEQVKSMLLMKCINEFLDDKRIKTLAIASAWLGNDETHYVRKHEEYGLEQLKLFINTVVSFIDSEMNYRKAVELIEKK